MSHHQEDLCYCKDKDRQGFMICCERCDIWYHYRCINTEWDLPLNKRQVRKLVNYYCYPCRRANPLLKMKYYSSENFAGLQTTNQQVEGELVITKMNQQQAHIQSEQYDSTKSLLREQSTSNIQQHFSKDGSTMRHKHRTRTLSKSIGDLANDINPMMDHERQRSSERSATQSEKHQQHRSESIDVSPLYSGYSTSISTISSLSSPFLSSSSSYSSSSSSRYSSSNSPPMSFSPHNPSTSANN